jgi:hypothetical protein
MKPILYVGAALMVGASIYGFVDYKKASQKREFSNMYEATEKTNEVLPAKETINENEPVNDVKPEMTKKLVIPVKKELIKEDLSEDSYESFFDDEIEPVEKIESEKTVVKEPELKGNTETKNVIPAKKKKKLNYKLFSRAPLEEKYLEKELKLEELIKPESKKTDNKQ